MQIKVWKENCNFLKKTCSNVFFFHSIPNYTPIWGNNNMFYVNFKKIGYSFIQNKTFQKSKVVAKMVDMLWNGCYHSKSS